MAKGGAAARPVRSGASPVALRAPPAECALAPGPGRRASGHTGLVSGSFLHPPDLTFLRLKLFSMPRRHISGLHVLNLIE